MSLNPVLKEQVVNRAVRALRKDNRIEQISFATIANELGVRIEDLQGYYSSAEDIFLKAQQKDWDAIHRYWDSKIKKAKTPGDFKDAFNAFFERVVKNLSNDADLRLEMSCYLKSCRQYREKNRKKLRQKFNRLIKRGWPGKQEKVVARQTELVVMIFYGFLDHVVHIPKKERVKILRDLRNMLNLHLQDRRFF
ncbi:MAG TPA: hypothetical protein EYF97_04770 [Gammaproteobacteria bacterium]|jgi:hypothetical protein|nr:hypothetical protein [Gammaproteobacteria bacterium]HIK72568.1 hypothetical protein [Gammaproteobacteria bacterium]